MGVYVGVVVIVGVSAVWVVFWAWQTTCKNVESKNKGDCFCLAKQNNIFFLDNRAG